MIKSMANKIGGYQGFFLKLLLNKFFAKPVLKLLGDQSKYFEVLLYNSYNLTKVVGGTNINVIPSLAEAYIDVRLLPGENIEDFVKEIQPILEDVKIETLIFDENNAGLNMKHFDSLANIIISKDSDAKPIPFVMTGVSDGRFLSKLGIQTYGFTPLTYEREFNMVDYIHNADERMPIKGLNFGVECVEQFLLLYE